MIAQILTNACQVDVPFSKFLKDPSLALSGIDDVSSLTSPSSPSTIAFICRRGNDSLLASRALRRWVHEKSEGEEGESKEGIRIVDVLGGLTAYAREEEGFPIY